MNARTVRAVVAGLGMAGLAVAGLGFVASSGSAARAHRDAMQALETRHQELEAQLEKAIARDSVLRFAATDSSAIAVALRESLLIAVLEQVALRYLDRVEIDLVGLPGHGEGDFEVKTPFGRMTAGDWAVKVNVKDLRGTLTALEPTIDVNATNRIAVALPIRVEGGRGRVTLDFAWNSKSIFNFVCKDFETQRELEGRVLPQRHLVRGTLVLSANAQGIVADPEFPPVRFPIAMELDEASWERIREALEDQDKLAKCGLMLKPDRVLEDLRALGLRGLRFRLPKAAYRRFVLPTRISESVEILQRPVALDVHPHRLRVTPQMFWYSADVAVRRATGPEHRLPVPAPETVR